MNLLESLNYAEDNECNDCVKLMIALMNAPVNAASTSGTGMERPETSAATRDKLNKWVNDVIDKEAQR